MSHLVFVYGTLKSGRSNNRLLATADFMGEAMTVERYGIDRNFPQVFAAADGPFRVAPCWLGHVRGEVYDCDDSTLELLDRLERNGQSYERKLVPVQAEEGGPTVNAWLYFMPHIRAPHAVYRAPDTNGTHTWGRS